MSTDTISPLRQRMIEDMNARKLCAATQTGHIRSCKRFAAFLNRSPDTATLEDIRLFQLHLAETGVSICNRNRIMTGLRFLFRVTLRRLALAAGIYHLREPQKMPPARERLAVPSPPKEPETPEAAVDEPRVLPRPCPCCGRRMIVIETFARGCEPKPRPAPPPAAIRIDTS